MIKLIDNYGQIKKDDVLVIEKTNGVKFLAAAIINSMKTHQS